MDKIYCVLDMCGDLQTWMNGFWLLLGFIIWLVIATLKNNE
jgi:hypothetical protein